MCVLPWVWWTWCRALHAERRDPSGLRSGWPLTPGSWFWEQKKKSYTLHMICSFYFWMTLKNRSNTESITAVFALITSLQIVQICCWFLSRMSKSLYSMSFLGCGLTVLAAPRRGRRGTGRPWTTGSPAWAVPEPPAWSPRRWAGSPAACLTGWTLCCKQTTDACCFVTFIFTVLSYSLGM